MTGYDIYVLCLCFLVFALLTGILSLMLSRILKLTTKSIQHGLEDERIKIEYQKEQDAHPAGQIIHKILSALLLAVLLALFIISVSIQLADDKVTGNVSLPQVVLSSSMSRQRESNQYLMDNNLTDQFDRFDLVFTHELPDEFDIQLYDIVVYEREGKLIIHRIIGIEEPNDKHPNHRHFILRGDAVQYSDEFPVLYEQMKAIYRGRRIPFVGGFFAFMQSPAGYLCILLVVFAMFATPIAEKRLWAAKIARLNEIGAIPLSEQDIKRRGNPDGEEAEQEKEAVYEEK